MSTSMRLLARSASGKLLLCDCCDTLYLEFGMLCWRFQPEMFATFHTFIEGLQLDPVGPAEPSRAEAGIVRVALPPTNLALALTVSQVEELRFLLGKGRTALETAGLCEEIEAWLNQL